MNVRRLLLLITDLEIGGTPTVVRELAKRLGPASGGALSVEVACLSRRGPVADQIEAAGVPVHALGASSSLEIGRIVGALASLARRREYDTVFSFLLHANAVAAAASVVLPGVRFLQSIQTTQPWPRWHWIAQRLAHRAAECVIVPSAAVAWCAVQRSGLPREKLIVIPNAIDPNDFGRVPVFMNPACVRVGFLGRLDPVKRVPDFVRAIARCGQGVEGHIFGEGPDRPAIERAIGDARTKNVMLHGAVASPQEALGRMDVLVLPSVGEGFGLVLIEAMASGVPVIARGVGGVLDVVRQGENGLLIGHSADFEVELPRCIDRLRNDPAIRARLIDGGLATVRDRYAWASVLPQYLSILAPRRHQSNVSGASPLGRDFQRR